ncbi:MAG: transposase, partial [Opitutales bacterium]
MRRRLRCFDSSACIHHAMSRVVGGQMLLGDREKEVFRKMLWQVADFSGVEVLTYCIMDNHFHVLVRVPERDRAISDAELLRRFRVLYPKPTKYQTASFKRFEAGLQAGAEEAVAMRERLLTRMHDLSEFMKTLKQRFSIWYNRNHNKRLGTLWMERFKSVLVQGAGNPLHTMAAYIDLNPVRAGLVEDPKDYRWCGYAEAVAGNRLAQRGLARIWSTYADGTAREGNATCLQVALADHRSLIFGKGSSPWTCRGKVIDRA